MTSVSDWKIALAADGMALAASAQAGEIITHTYDVHGRVTRAAHSGTARDGVSAGYPQGKPGHWTNMPVDAASLMVAPDPREAPPPWSTDALSNAPPLATTATSQLQSRPGPTELMPGPSRPCAGA